MKRAKLLLNVVVLVLMLVIQTDLWAATYDIKEMTPEVKSALDARRSRYEQLSALKAQGAVGENNRGYVEVLKSEGDAQSIADAENRDRKVIYNTIVAQNGLGGDALSTIEKVFAQVQRDKAAGGDSIQDEAGNWKKK